jgi:NAD-dependent SIR2 family protein deacetylase
MTTTNTEIATTVKQLFHNASGLVIFAGAGMSVDSGIPDFRGNSGIWTSDKQNFIKFASGSAFHKNPLDSWNFYITRFMRHGDSIPHRGYHQLLDCHPDIYVVTSNVDELFHKCGYDSRKIFEIHGNLREIQCSRGCTRELQPMPVFTHTATSTDQLPHCHHCGSVMRPNVKMFNDPWFVFTQTQRQADSFSEWLMGKTNVLGVEIGAGLSVPNIRIMATECTHALIRINPHDHTVSRPQDLSICSTAVDGINTLVELLSDRAMKVNE